MSITKTGILNGNYLYEDNYPNLLTGYTWITGKYYANDGSLIASGNTKYVIDYIPIIPGINYKITITDNTTNHMRIHEYTKDQTWIRQAIDTTNKTITWTTNNTAAYIRISLPINATDMILQRDILKPMASIRNNQDIISNQFYEY